MATAPSAMSALIRQLVVLKSQLMLSAAEAQGRTPWEPREAKGPGGLQSRLASRASSASPSMGKAAPDVAMEAVAAMAAVHHAWRGSDSWRLEEQRLVQQQLDALRGRPDTSTRIASKIEVGTPFRGCDERTRIHRGALASPPSSW